jgi:hypothetical protein
MGDLLKQKLEEVEKWKSRLQEKEMENSRLRNMETQIPQYDAKLDMMRVENDRIGNILKSRLGEIETWKKRAA